VNTVIESGIFPGASMDLRNIFEGDGFAYNRHAKINFFVRKDQWVPGGIIASFLMEAVP
jgi:hypothetical protein